MDILEILKAILLGIVQGITEWLPISSTGHLILAEHLLQMQSSDVFKETFDVVIQLGSILAVVVLYFHKLNPFSPRKNEIQKRETWSLWSKVVVAAVPAGIVGLLFNDSIDEVFYNVPTVSVMLILYGVLFIWVESRHKKPRIGNFQQLDYRTALFIGVFQMLALIPGTSRSGATILGAILLGSSRYIAAEFSFFLAIPMMVAASGLKLVKSGLDFTGTEWTALITGTVVAFVVSIFAIKFLMGFIKKHDFKPFGYYRIAVGIIFLLYFLLTDAKIAA